MPEYAMSRVGGNGIEGELGGGNEMSANGFGGITDSEATNGGGNGGTTQIGNITTSGEGGGNISTPNSETILPPTTNSNNVGIDGKFRGEYNENGNKIIESVGKTVSTDNQTFFENKEQSVSEKATLLDEYIKSNNIKNPPVSNEEILNLTDGSLELAKNVVEATKEVIPGKSISELVDIFKIPDDPTSSSLSTYQTRIWYKWQESLIGDNLDYSKPLEQVARNAFDMRNEIRTKARDSMSDRALAELLMKKERNLTFEELIKRNKDKGLNGDEIWKKIIKSSMSSRDYVNKLFQIE